MKNGYFVKIVFFLLLGCWISPSQALVPARYLGKPQSIDLTITSFNKVISSNRLSQQALTERILGRGQHYASLFRFKDAIADYNHAIRLNPNFIDAYIYRGIGFARLEQYKRAYADFAKVLTRQPSNLEARLRRGVLYFLHGKYAKAIDDFEQYLQYQPNDLYRVLWIYLAERYSKQEFTTTRRHVKALDLVVWPGALVELYLGDVAIKDLVKALNPKLGTWQARHRCEAYFYLGQYFLLQNNRKQAMAYFEQAIRTRAKDQLEYEFSIAYLRKLQKKP